MLAGVATAAGPQPDAATHCAYAMWVQAHTWASAMRPRAGAVARQAGRGTTAARGRRWVLGGGVHHLISMEHDTAVRLERGEQVGSAGLPGQSKGKCTWCSAAPRRPPLAGSTLRLLVRHASAAGEGAIPAGAALRFDVSRAWRVGCPAQLC